MQTKLKRFFDEKTPEKLSNKKALLHFLKLPQENYQLFLEKKSIELLEKKILDLEIEIELSFLNDRWGGGKKIYAEKFHEKVKNNIDNNIIINFGKEDLKKLEIKEVNNFEK